VGNFSHRLLNLYKSPSHPLQNLQETARQWHYATRRDSEPPNKHSWQVHGSAYILETKCKGRAAHILVVQFVIQPPVERKKIARDWRRSSSRQDESKPECEGRKEGGVCAWRVDLRVNGREIESESMASAQRWWTCGESADGELAVSWWALIKRIVLIE
jgi:hypothetical protein